MKILHLADLHIGKKVNGFCLLKDQKFVLEQALTLIKKEKIEAILIAGDVFDRPIPPLGALELFNFFLKEIQKNNIKTIIIPGNHDSSDRISYLSDILEQSNIFITKPYEGKINKISLNEEIEIYPIPYIYPALVKKFHNDEEIKSYNDALKTIIKNIDLNKNKFNIAIVHQFVTGKTQPILSQSEQKSVGGLDEINYELFKNFNYTALGHLHCAQKCGSEKIYYSGSILKYSFSEINHQKKFCVLNIENKTLTQEFHPINFLHEMREYRGYIEDFLDKKFYNSIKLDDYIHFILEDEYVLDAKKKLSTIYPNIMLLEFDNSFTKNINKNFDINPQNNKTIIEHFSDFYKLQLNSEIDLEKQELINKIGNEEGLCDQLN